MAAPEPSSSDQGSSNLTLRAVSALVFVPVILLLVETGGWALLGLVLCIAGRCAWEFYQLNRQAGYRPDRYLGFLLALGLCLCIFFFGPRPLPLVLVGAVLLVFAAALRQGTKDYVANALLTLGGALYTGLLGSAPLLIARTAGPDHGPEAGHLLLVVFAGIWLTDAAAYLCGRRWGKRKLAPRISPAKTLVGFFAGLGGGLLPLALGGLLPSFSGLELAGLLLLVSLGGQLGDLVESAIKRGAGAKDAPALIPGHGGLLDRFDSYFFAFPLAHLYVEGLAIFAP